MRFKKMLAVRKRIYALAHQLNQEQKKIKRKLNYYEKYDDYLND